MLRRPALTLLVVGVVCLVIAWFWGGTAFHDPPDEENGWALNVDPFGIIGIAAIGGALGWTIAGATARARARRRGRR